MLKDAVVAAVRMDAAPPDRFAAGMRAYLEALAERPAFARMFVIEVIAAGPAALARRTAAHEGLVSRVIN